MGTLADEFGETASCGIAKAHTSEDKPIASIPDSTAEIPTTAENRSPLQEADSRGKVLVQCETSENTEAVVFAKNSDHEAMAAEIPAVALEHPEASVPVPTLEQSEGSLPVPAATPSVSADSSAEKVVDEMTDAAEKELDDSETHSPSVATECEASEVEKDLTSQSVEDAEAVVLANNLDQEAMAAVVPAESKQNRTAVVPIESKQNRNEKESRKAMQMLGMRPVPGILRVTIKKSENTLFVVHQPDVFKSPKKGYVRCLWRSQGRRFFGRISGGGR